jgi:hypothetical protein
MDQVTSLDPNAHRPTYQEGGCNYLLGWFRDRIGPMTVLADENLE